MKTETLIQTLAADIVPERRPTTFLAGGLIAAFGVTVLLVWFLLGFRSDLADTMGDPPSALRFFLAGSLALVSARMVRLLATPGGDRLIRLWPLAALAVVALGALVWAGITTPTEALGMAVVGKTMINCLVSIPLLSLVPVAAVLAALRQGAPTAPGLAGGAAGLCGGGLAAMVYALHCTEDSPLFYVTWYGLAIIGVTLASALIGARLLRW